MKVTDLNYYMEKALVERLITLCHRCMGKNKHQNVLICDGTEGFGKSTCTAGQGYFMGWYMKRPIKLFFEPDKLITYAINHEDEILIWDDAAFAALSVQAYNKTILKLIKAIWLARKKRHTYFINIQEVFRLKEMLVSRAVGLTHVYSRDEKTLGRFVYYRKNKLQLLYNIWLKSKRKLYKKYYSLRGTFPNVLYQIFDEEQYEFLKDQAILSIDEDEKLSKTEVKYRILKKQYATLPGLTNKQKAEHAHLSEEAIRKWSFIDEKELKETPLVLSNPHNPSDIINKGFIEPKNQNYLKLKPNSKSKKVLAKLGSS